MNSDTSISTVTLAVGLLLLRLSSVVAAAGPAVLTVTTEPPDASVQITSAAGKAYITGTPTAPGLYHLSVSRRGFESRQYSIALAEEHQAVRIILQPERMATASPSFPRSALLGREGSGRPGALNTIHGAPQLARYSTQAPVPSPNQQQLLDAVIPSLRLGPDVRTVGEAIQRVLAGSGYSLARGVVTDPEQPKLLSLALPQAHRRFGPIAIRHALTTLAGPGWQLVVDPVHRQVAYEVSATFRLQETAASWTR